MTKARQDPWPWSIIYLGRRGNKDQLTYQPPFKNRPYGGQAGIGKLEPLKYYQQYYWSRRLEEFNRQVFLVENECTNSAMPVKI
jgi:hypothetical protein